MLFVAFPLPLLIFFSLCLIFLDLSNMCLGMFLLGFTLYETLFASWTLVIISFPMLGKFSTIVSSNSFSDPFFLFFFWDSYNSNIDVFSVVPEVSETVLISLHSFFLYSVP